MNACPITGALNAGECLKNPASEVAISLAMLQLLCREALRLKVCLFPNGDLAAIRSPSGPPFAAEVLHLTSFFIVSSLFNRHTESNMFAARKIHVLGFQNWERHAFWLCKPAGFYELVILLLATYARVDLLSK